MRGSIITADIGAEFFNVERLPLRQLIKFIDSDVKNRVIVRFFKSMSMLFKNMIKGADIMMGRLLIMKLFKIFARM